MTDLLVVQFGADGRVGVSVRQSGDLVPDPVGAPVDWTSPLAAEELEDLRWYLEEYLTAPFAVYEERGSRIQGLLPAWGERLFGSVFGSDAARDAYAEVRGRGGATEVVFQSEVAGPLGLPWELMRDPLRPGPLALGATAVTRMLPARRLAAPFAAAGGERLRVLMVISRPQGPDDVAYQMIARRLLTLLPAVRGAVDLVVLRPPTLERLAEVLAEAVAAGEPFQIVHFDGHGVFGTAPSGAGRLDPHRFATAAPSGMLAFEKAGGGSDLVHADVVAGVLADGRVPVVVLNACQSGQLGGQVEAAVATRLLLGGASSVVAMAYSVYVVAAAEFMATFYERLFAGDRVSDAVTAARHHLARADLRPSPKGLLPLADWMVPVHYARRDVSFPGLQAVAPTAQPLDSILEQFRQDPTGGDRGGGAGDELEPDRSFVGRDGLLYTLDAAARLDKVVVLHGPGGTGKTELAKAFGRWWRDTRGVEQPEWVIWQSFEPGVASFGLDGVVNEIGLRVFGQQFALLDDAGRRGAVAELLRTRRLLLIWDNFESVHTMPDDTAATPALDEAGRDELRAFLGRIRAGGASSVVVTSRAAEDWLGDVRRIEVGGLGPEDAVSYAEQLLAPYPRAQARRKLRAFAELMDWLDGHPLSMRLILPLMQDTDPQVLLDGLRGTAALPVRDGGGRMTSLAASIAYSFTHLSISDQAVLCAAALFHGVADANVLGIFSAQPGVPERFSGLDAEDWERVLDRAAAVGLLTRLGARMYRIHPALPAYLADRWRTEDPAGFNDERAAATAELLDAWAALGQWLQQQIDSGNARVALTVIGLHRRNLGAMLGYALDHTLWDQAQDIAQPVDYYWDMRGLLQEARGWVGRARLVLEEADGTPPDLTTPAGSLWQFLLVSDANRQSRAHRLDEAENTYKTILAALQALEPTGDRQRRSAVISHNLGILAQDRGLWDEAEDWYRRSLTIKEDLGNRPGAADSYHQLGILAQDRGLWDEAEDWYRRSLTTFEELGDRPGAASSYHQLGILAQTRGRWEDAEDWYRRSLTINEELGDRPGAASSYHQLGILAQTRGRWEDAEDWYRRSLTINEQLGNRPGAALTRAQLALLADEQEQPQQAMHWAVTCVALFDQIPHPATGTGPLHLKDLTARLGLPALERIWAETTGTPLPDHVRRYVQTPESPDPEEAAS